MNNEGLLTIKFEPEIEVGDKNSFQRLKEENLIQLKLLPNSEAIDWLDKSFFEFDW